MGALSSFVIPLDFLIDPQMVIPDQDCLGRCAIGQVVNHEHRAESSHEIAVLLPVVAQ